MKESLKDRSGSFHSLTALIGRAAPTNQVPTISILRTFVFDSVMCHVFVVFLIDLPFTCAKTHLNPQAPRFTLDTHKTIGPHNIISHTVMKHIYGLIEKSTEKYDHKEFL